MPFPFGPFLEADCISSPDSGGCHVQKFGHYCGLCSDFWTTEIGLKDEGLALWWMRHELKIRPREAREKSYVYRSLAA